MVRILRSDDYRAMPWKNGGGTTKEVLVRPRLANLYDFDWRVSIANVQKDGPFSELPQIDRSLSILEGAGIELSFAEGPTVALRQHSEPYAFPGELLAHATLLSGAVTDINVMTRRNRFWHKMSRVAVLDHLLLRSSNTYRLVLATSPIPIRYGMHSLASYDAVLVEPYESSVLLTTDSSCAVLAIEIGSRSFAG